MDAEEPLLHWKHECVLLSRQLKHPIDFQPSWLRHYRTLDLVGDICLVNVMVLGRDEESKLYRRGIVMMREDMWWSFQPTWIILHLS